MTTAHVFTPDAVSHPAFLQPMTHGEAMRFAFWARGVANSYPDDAKRMRAVADEIEAGVRAYQPKISKKEK